ncbi:MAG TPA: hypothetical protein VJN88_15075, partial [Ktedonobacterales bacterium]|nr:hypothetical protein [Ktedonobacterales bacterium]
ARRMVREFGMSPLGNVLIEDEGVSPQRATQADAEESYLVEQAYTTAKDILEAKKDKLIAISEHLIQVETIDAPELDRLLFGEDDDMSGVLGAAEHASVPDTRQSA